MGLRAGRSRPGRYAVSRESPIYSDERRKTELLILHIAHIPVLSMSERCPLKPTLDDLRHIGAIGHLPINKQGKRVNGIIVLVLAHHGV